MELDEIKKLTDLARIEMTQEEMQEMAGDFESILTYVGQIQKANISTEKNQNNNILENVVREDVITNKTGEFSGSILEEMPETQDNFLKVKKIL